MSTPDLRGTQGTFTRFSTRTAVGSSEGGVHRRLLAAAGVLKGSLQGPERMAIDFSLSAGHSTSTRTLQIQGQTIALTEGEYTHWIRLRFSDGILSSARGIVRFLLTESDPEVSIYVTPVEIDPGNPALPISYPGHYAVYLAKLLGSFATLGMAEDTWALNEGAIDENAFLQQAKLIQQEREAMFYSALERTRRGVVACVFDTPDRVQHMFYRYIDPSCTHHRESPHTGNIEKMYCDMDRIVGRTLAYVDSDTALFVLSDHGFSSFRRGVNLNSWLHRNGYLALLPGVTSGGEYFEGVDWTKTRAYTFGLGGLYLNLHGREAQGIVAANDAASLKEELLTKLRGMTDDDSGDVAIRNVYDSEAIYNGPYVDAAPDLVIGYAPGYRASWSAAVGEVSNAVFEDNTKRWSGDHCIDPSAVPGVLFVNRKLAEDAPGTCNPGIEDMAPTVLRLFGVDVPRWMEGRALMTA